MLKRVKSQKASLSRQKPDRVVATVSASQKGRPKLVGYARVSSDDQTTALQRDALTAAGCAYIFEDSASGARTDRPALNEAIASLNPGDTLVVWKLDRLGRSLTHLVAVADQLRERDVYFRSVTEAIDTSTASGRLLYAVLGAVAQFERDVIVERTRAGMKAAKKRGVHVGRRVSLKPSQVEEARKMMEREHDPKTGSEVARLFGVGRATLYRHIGSLQK
jgi:DNA invertase Pin-like site-specific DNA recombinase